MKISSAILSLLPNAEFAIEDNSYDKIQWFDERPMPSREEVEAEVTRLQSEWVRTEYKRQRQPEYPPITDLADALYWQSQGDDSKLTEYYQKVAAVKNKYPKE